MRLYARHLIDQTQAAYDDLSKDGGIVFDHLTDWTHVVLTEEELQEIRDLLHPQRQKERHRQKEFWTLL